jgi:hypothetical protein
LAEIWQVQRVLPIGSDCFWLATQRQTPFSDQVSGEANAWTYFSLCWYRFRDKRR